MNANTTTSALPLVHPHPAITLRLLAPSVPASVSLEPAPEAEVAEPESESLSALIARQRRPDKAEAWLYAAISVGTLLAVAWAVWDSVSVVAYWQGFERFVGQLVN